MNKIKCSPFGVICKEDAVWIATRLCCGEWMGVCDLHNIQATEELIELRDDPGWVISCCTCGHKFEGDPFNWIQVERL